MKSPSVPSKDSHATISFSFHLEPQENDSFQPSSPRNGPLGSLSAKWNSDHPFLHLSPPSCSNQASFHSSPVLKIEFAGTHLLVCQKRPELHPISQGFPPSYPLQMPPSFPPLSLREDVSGGLLIISAFFKRRMD